MEDKTKAILTIIAPDGFEFAEKGAIVNQCDAVNGICVEMFIPTRTIEPNQKICQVTLQDGTVMEYPEPVRVPLKFGQVYWAVRFIENLLEWGNDEVDNTLLKAGLIHLSSQAAQQHLDVLEAINKQTAI